MRDIFHIAMLGKYKSDPCQVISFDNIKLEENCRKLRTKVIFIKKSYLAMRQNDRRSDIGS